jgi:hypothetical protein
MTEHSFQGITPSPLRGESVTYVSGTMCYLCLRPLIVGVTDLPASPSSCSSSSTADSLYAPKNSLEMEPEPGVHARIVDEVLPMSSNTFQELAGFTGESQTDSLSALAHVGNGLPRS